MHLSESIDLIRGWVWRFEGKKNKFECLGSLNDNGSYDKPLNTEEALVVSEPPTSL